MPVKGWHADHLEPIKRYKSLRSTDTGYESFNTCEKPHLDLIDNMVPACRKCNLFKGVFSVDEFREELSCQVSRAREYSVNFRNAERFGLIETNNNPVVFWFERKEI